MHCPHCAGAIRGDEKFCPHCGAAQPRPVRRDGAGRQEGSLSDRGTHTDAAGPQSAPGGEDGGQIGSLSDRDTHTDGGPQAPPARRYRVVRELGAGGMGVVCLAEDTHTFNRPVALKRLKARDEATQRTIRRFLTEAEAVVRLSDLDFNIVTVHEIGEDADGPYIAMEYVDGGSLAELIQREGALPVERAVEITAQLAKALQVAHEHGIIHRDIKPANILLTSRGTPKIADFGLARMEALPTVTDRTAVLGTVDYMAPEQRLNPAGVDHRADIYSLGATLYEMVTGHSPGVIRSDAIPAVIRDVVLKAVEEHPDRRYQTAEAFAQALSEAMTVSTPPPEGACPECGTVNPPDSRFCLKCRHSLMVTCYECGADTPRGSTYCRSCGLHLEAFARDRRQSIARHIARAEDLLRKREFNAALAELEPVLKDTHPDFADGVTRARRIEEQVREAQADAHAEFLHHLAALDQLIADQRYDDAVRHAQAVPEYLRNQVIADRQATAERKAEHARALAQEAEAALKKGDPRAAFETLKKLLRATGYATAQTGSG